MIVIDNKKNIYTIHFYNTYAIDWAEDFFNAGSWNTVEVSFDSYAYECGTDIQVLIDYMNDYMNNEGDFIDDEDPKDGVFFTITGNGK